MHYKCPSCKAILNVNHDYRHPSKVSFSRATESSICNFVEVCFKDSKLCYLYFILQEARSITLYANDPTKIFFWLEKISMPMDIDPSKYSENNIDELFHDCMGMVSRIKDNLSLM